MTDTDTKEKRMREKVLKILAYMVAVIGWLVLITILGGMLLLLGVVAYTEVSEIGIGAVAKNVALVIAGVIVFFAVIGLWVAACNYVGWGDE